MNSSLKNLLRLALVLPQVAVAAPGVIADQPVLLGSRVQPNLFVLLDDSESMDWNLLTGEAEGKLTVGALEYRYTHPVADNKAGATYVPPHESALPADVAAAGGFWRAWSRAYNRLYYDPTVIYAPWTGTDKAGVAYADANPLAARLDPYDPAVGVVDLTAPMSYTTAYDLTVAYGDEGTVTVTGFAPAQYYTWTDTDGDGVVDAGDAHTQVVITDAAGLKNFANWFTYHRRREYIAKASLADLIDDSVARVGLSTLNSGTTVGRAVRNIDDVTTPVDPVAAADKKALLGALFKVDSGGAGTPLRERFAEVGRYFEGLSTTQLFPYAPSPATPILSSAEGGECQVHEALLVTDGYWNDAGVVVGNADGDASSAFDNRDFASYGDTFSDTLADLAMHYFERDLATAVGDAVPAGGTPANPDDNPAQHLGVSAVHLGAGATLPVPTDRTAAVTWPAPLPGDASALDDLLHATWNARGSFLTVTGPATLASALEGAFAAANDRAGSAAPAAFSSASLATGSRVYVTGFESNPWFGRLDAFDVTAVTPTSTHPTGFVLTERWSAQEKLAERDLSASPRTLLTWDTGTKKGISLDRTAFSGTGIDPYKDLAVGAPATEPGKGDFIDRRIAWLRGDGSNEVGAGGTDEFRSRTVAGERRLLGDIIASAAVHVGAPSARYPDSIPEVESSYAAFAAANAARQPMVYVAANDGGLHGFDADSGEERLFYLPEPVFTSTASQGVHFLTETGYTHRYYADVTPTVADVYVGGAWRSYLVGALGKGGKGIYVLDVTDPSVLDRTKPGFSEASAATAVVKNDTVISSDLLGYTYARPQIARMAAPSATDGTHWAAVIGNGYNSKTGDASIYIVYLDGKKNILFSTKTDPKTKGFAGSVDCKNGGTFGGYPCNGMSTPRLADTNGDGIIDRIYAGDLLGNVWVFDVSDTKGGSLWKTAYGTTSYPLPLFTARDASGNAQPITAQVALARHPTQSGSATSPNLLVSLGTGQLLADADAASSADQSFYTVWDRGTGELVRGDLNEQFISTVTEGGETVRVIDDGADGATAYGSDPATTDFGWFADLPTGGERVVGRAVPLGDVVFFDTVIPSSDVCATGGATGWFMAADLDSGGEPPLDVIDRDSSGDFGTGDLVAGRRVSGVEVTSFGGGGSYALGAAGVTRFAVGAGGVLGMNLVQPRVPTPNARLSWSVVPFE